MAKATKHHDAVPVPPYTVTLELSQREAEVLFRVVGAISGPPEGPRGCIDGIREALKWAGVDFIECGRSGIIDLDMWP